jgi:Tfp pilus assembly protein PilV
MQTMGEVIITILVMAVGALIGIGGVVLLLYIFAD